MMKKNQVTSDFSEQNQKIPRRDFLKFSAFALGFMAADIVKADSEPLTDFVIDPDWNTDRIFREVKSAFVLSENHTYLNIGTTGSMPLPVLDNFNQYNRLVAERPWDMGDEWGGFPYTSSLAGQMAPQFGCDPHELILTRNTTDGMITILQGLDLREGDHIVTTHHEHIAATGPLWVLMDRYGVTVEQVQIPVLSEDLTSPEDYVDRIISAAEANSNTRLIVVSHAVYKTGAILPVARICEEASARGIVTLIDGAHCPGMLNINLHSIGCDFYAGSGHKWQCGPGGTGLLFVRDNVVRLGEYWPDRKPGWAVMSSLPEYISFVGLQTTLQYKGNDNYPALRALADACDFFEMIGRDRIQEWDRDLIALLRQRIQAAFPQVVIYTPEFRECTGGILAFNPFSDQTDLSILNEFRDRLNSEYGYVVRTTDFKVYLSDKINSHALRVSCHLFHDPSDIEGLVESMVDLYSRMVS